MGKRGPPARPVETLKLIGSSEQYRRQGEVSIVDGCPVMPEWLPVEAGPHWDHWVDTLSNQGVNSASWYVGLAAYCAAIVEWEELEQACIEARKNGQITYCTEKGAIIANPIFAMRDKAAARVHTFGREFGYTPASKTAIRTEVKPAGKDKSRFVKGTG